MQRSELRSVFLKNRTEETRNIYIKESNLCVTLSRESKREFFGSLSEADLCDNKKLWGVVKPLSSNKVVSDEKITLVEDNNIVENDKNASSVLNEFFSNVIATLGIPYKETEPVSHNIGDPLMKAAIKYGFHPSIIAINQNCNLGLSFSFSQGEPDEIMKEINNLKTNKATQSTDMPTKFIKENFDIFWRFCF